MKEKYPLYQDKDGYNIGNVGALKVGWEEALRWAISRDTGPCSFNGCNIRDIIEKELEE